MTLVQSLYPVIQVLLGTGFTWGVTGLAARATLLMHWRLPWALWFSF